MTDISRSYFPVPTSAFRKPKRKLKFDDFTYIPSAVPAPFLNFTTPTMLQGDPIQDSTVSQTPLMIVEQERLFNNRYLDDVFTNGSDASTSSYPSSVGSFPFEDEEKREMELVETDAYVTNLTNRLNELFEESPLTNLTNRFEEFEELLDQSPFTNRYVSPVRSLSGLSTFEESIFGLEEAEAELERDANLEEQLETRPRTRRTAQEMREARGMGTMDRGAPDRRVTRAMAERLRNIQNNPFLEPMGLQERNNYNEPMN